MSDTPKTDVFREVIFAQYKEDELTGDGMGNILAALPDIESLERELQAERALADRLHGALDALDYNLAFAGNTLIGGLRERVTAMRAIALPALAAWKEARND